MSTVLYGQIELASELIKNLDLDITIKEGIIKKNSCPEPSIDITIDLIDEYDKKMYRYYLQFGRNYPFYPPYISVLPKIELELKQFKEHWSPTFTISKIIQYIYQNHRIQEKA